MVTQELRIAEEDLVPSLLGDVNRVLLREQGSGEWLLHKSRQSPSKSNATSELHWKVLVVILAAGVDAKSAETHGRIRLKLGLIDPDESAPSKAASASGGQGAEAARHAEVAGRVEES